MSPELAVVHSVYRLETAAIRKNEVEIASDRNKKIAVTEESPHFCRMQQEKWRAFLTDQKRDQLLVDNKVTHIVSMPDCENSKGIPIF